MITYQIAASNVTFYLTMPYRLFGALRAQNAVIKSLVKKNLARAPLYLNF